MKTRCMVKHPKGVKCRCGHFEPFAGYVYAHWDITLTFVCPACSDKCSIKRGKVVQEEI